MHYCTKELLENEEWQHLSSFSEEDQNDIKAMADEMMLECCLQAIREELVIPPIKTESLY